MIREILRMGDPRLTRVARPVGQFDTAALRELVGDLFDTMRSVGGVGLAAPQIGIDARVVIFGFAGDGQRHPDQEPVPETVLVNPRLDVLDAHEVEDWEGCLSVPGMRGVVPRAPRIRYRGFDAEGRAIDRIANDFHARVVQHECDHLDGILYPMRIRDLTRFGFNEALFPGKVVVED